MQIRELSLLPVLFRFTIASLLTSDGILILNDEKRYTELVPLSK